MTLAQPHTCPGTPFNPNYGVGAITHSLPDLLLSHFFTPAYQQRFSPIIHFLPESYAPDLNIVLAQSKLRPLCYRSSLDYIP